MALSTDLVLAGDRPFLPEDAATEPLSVYGRTKRAGELAVLAALPAAAVARLALVAGRGHGAHATSTEQVAAALRAGRAPRLFTDEYRTPIDPESVADAAARLLAGSAAGIFHLGGPERVSRYELGVRVARAFGLRAEGIVPALQREHAGPERRAPDVSLDSGAPGASWAGSRGRSTPRSGTAGSSWDWLLLRRREPERQRQAAERELVAVLDRRSSGGNEEGNSAWSS